MAKKSIADTQKIDPTTINPQTPREYYTRGWMYYSLGELSKAEDDFRTALKEQSDEIDYLYALGMTLSAHAQTQDALKVFEECEARIESMENGSRQTMLRRLVHGHINRIKTGDWHIVA